MIPAPFALLDDASSTAAATSRLHLDFVREHVGFDAASLDAVWAAVEADQRRGLHAVLRIDYEWGLALQGLPPSRPGALRVMMFGTLQRLDAVAVEAWLAEADGDATPTPAGVMDLAPDLPRDAYDAAVAQAQAWIRAGETYQLNLTYRLEGRAFGSPVGLYRRLRAQQPAAFGALIGLPDGSHVLSLSPEPFFSHRAGRLTARPMKGTAARGSDPDEDRRRAAWLAADLKNRAENLMITDLLRNDLGRIAETGSVRVPSLFAVETHPTLHQMTSTVEARLRSGLGFPDLLRALFPCGSITGAPKRHTMELIERLEPSPRGLYTGAIGWVEALSPGAACGDACLSVAIRTLELGPQAVDGTRPLRLGVGGGIVQDSVAADEHAESRLKARFVHAADPGFTLFETMRVECGTIVGLDAHLARLTRSAARLGFRCDETELRDRLSDAIAMLPVDVVHRLRLDLRHDGGVRTDIGVLAPLPEGLLSVGFSESRLTPLERALSGHKTSLRTTYDAAVREAERQGLFDLLFFDEHDALTEGGRSSVFVRIDGEWRTPPLSCGVLPGTARARLLADASLGAREAVIHRDELLTATELIVCNALRGACRAQLR